MWVCLPYYRHLLAWHVSYSILVVRLSEGGQAGLQPLEQQTNIIFTVLPCRWGGKLVVRGRDEGGCLSK